MRDNNLTILALVLILTTIMQSSFVIIKVYEARNLAIAGKAYDTNVGTISFCINIPPENLSITCSDRIREGVEISCQATAAEAQGEPIIFSYQFLYGQEFFSFAQDGSITIKTYNGTLESPPLLENYDFFLGNYTIKVTASDNSTCTNEDTSLNYHLEVYDVNDPPFQTQTLPDTIIPKDSYVSILTLNDYFDDPERQTLSYSTSSSSILLTIGGSSNVLALSTSCSTESVIFTATDTGNLSTNSNSVNIEVDCEDILGDESGSGSGGSGGGGSGGAGCISNWECDLWTDCSIAGFRTRTCTDLNACNPDYYIHEIEETCTYIPPAVCEEYWECSDWRPCQTSGTQTRDCTELNGCGTEENKSATIQECFYEATCTDGVKNQNETGIDCGGPCLPCSELQVPGTIQDEKTILSNILLIAIFILLSLLLIYKYFHKQINAAVIKLFLTITEKRYKRIFLSEKDKKYLLDKLLEVEKTIHKQNPNKVSMDISIVCREYFSRIFKIPLTFDKTQLDSYIKQLHIKEPLNSIFRSFYNKIISVETKQVRMYKTDLQIMSEEIREIIHQTSRFKKNDIKKEIKEIIIGKKDHPLMKMKKQMHNTYVAMHFNNIEVAKTKYSEIINLYENMSERLKGEVYTDIERLFNEIRYLLSIHR